MGLHMSDSIKGLDSIEGLGFIRQCPMCSGNMAYEILWDDYQHRPGSTCPISTLESRCEALARRLKALEKAK